MALTVCTIDIRWFLVMITYVVRIVRFINPQLPCKVVSVGKLGYKNRGIKINEIQPLPSSM